MIDLLKVQLSTFVLKMTVLLTEIKQASQGIAMWGVENMTLFVYSFEFTRHRADDTRNNTKDRVRI